jgi:MoxR-like ATPase
MRTAIESVHVDADLEAYIVAVVNDTRHDRRVAVGASPRASLAFLKVARAWAAMQGRDFVIPDDIKHFGIAVLSHRIILKPEHWMSRRVSTEVIQDIFGKVPVPVIGPMTSTPRVASRSPDGDAEALAPGSPGSLEEKS